jgi:hypothetical protein
MKKILLATSSMVLSFALAGCVASSQEIKLHSETIKADVFKEVKGGELQPGFADLIIKASFKTPVQQPSVDNKSQITTSRNEGYPFLLNIDGQAVQWVVEGKKETALFIDASGNHNQEGGEGIKYILEKKIRVKAGTHKVFFGLPAKNYYKQFEITVHEGKAYSIEFKPIYSWKHRNMVRSFEKGFAYYEVSVK